MIIDYISKLALLHSVYGVRGEPAETDCVFVFNSTQLVNYSLPKNINSDVANKFGVEWYYDNREIYNSQQNRGGM